LLRREFFYPSHPVFFCGTIRISTSINPRLGQYDQQQTQAPTADQQGTDPADQAIMQKIRKSIHGDKSLSTYGHNVKIITQNGTVTLSGPVKTLDDKNNIHAKAAAIAGEENIRDNLVAPPSN
jgi:hyperosmotically inducible periplasmic protein